MENCYRFFQNKECAYFPCHSVKEEGSFNCLFCYCPLYALGDQCGGNCVYLENGVKDCSGCLIPHDPKGYDYILERFDRLAALAKANRKEIEG